MALKRGSAAAGWKAAEAHLDRRTALRVCGSIQQEDAMPKKTLEKMSVPGVSREHVASHLQKYRLSLKQEDQRIPTIRGSQRTLCAQVPTHAPSPALHPPSQAQAPPASRPLHLPLPWQACFSGPEVSQPQRGHEYDQLLQTPPDPFWSNNIPIQEYHTPPLENTIGMPPDVEGVAQTMTGFPAGGAARARSIGISSYERQRGQHGTDVHER
ncbi:hypothetical protein BS78_03G135600 [Paspalum vaginatum]|nr:hypothetical protein BS78_03G135600 [Paspalum vaginatum]